MSGRLPLMSSRLEGFGAGEGRGERGFAAGVETLGGTLHGAGNSTGGGRVLNEHHERWLPSHAAVATEMELAPGPHDAVAEQISAQVMTEFMQRHTQLVAAAGRANASSPNTECPICLEPPSATHPCVQIRDVPGCKHLVGQECLKKFLLYKPDDKKECPLCRTEWLSEDGIWEDYEGVFVGHSGLGVQGDGEEWEQLARDRGVTRGVRRHTLDGFGNAPRYGPTTDLRHHGIHGIGHNGHVPDNTRRSDRHAGSYPPVYYRGVYSPNYESSDRGESPGRLRDFLDI
jgi:hypothetical protein